MVKERSTQQDAIRAAWNKPEKHFHFSRRMIWSHGKRPFKWGFFLGGGVLAIDIGELKNRFNGPEMPESQLTFSITVRPFGIICFWEQKRILWIGDWEWKKGLRSG